MGKTVILADGISGNVGEVSIDLENPTTVGDFFKIKYPAANPKDYSITVNRSPVRAEYILQAGDRIAISPTKIVGA
jgi:sulfur carrier protein ThiS